MKGMMLIMGFAKAYFIGLTIAFTIGPISLLIAQRGITRGVKSAMVTSLGVALADFTFALVACTVGVSVLLFVENYKQYVYLFSGIVLLALALHISYSAFKIYKQKIHVSAAKAKGSDCISAYALTIHNPMTIAVFLGFLSYMTGIQSVSGILLFAFFLFLGSLTGQLTIGLIASGLRGFFQNPKSILILNIMSATGIAAFAVVSFLKVF